MRAESRISDRIEAGNSKVSYLRRKAMSIRFRRSIELGPAFRINISKSGLSFSAHVPGMKGLSVSTGQKGTYLNAGLPGTGLSSRTMLS